MHVATKQADNILGAKAAVAQKILNNHIAVAAMVQPQFWSIAAVFLLQSRVSKNATAHATRSLGTVKLNLFAKDNYLCATRNEHQNPVCGEIKSREYHDRDVREAAYDRLITKLKEIEPDANKSSVVKKINNFRINVRKEKKKRDMSRKSGAGTDNVYSPKLWYFDLFDFLGDHDVPSTSSSNLDDEDVSEMDEEGSEGTIQQTPLIEEVSEQTIVTPNHRNRPEKEKLQAPLHPNIGKKTETEELTNDVLVSVRDHFKKPPPQDDRYDLMGKSIALRIRALEKRQRLIVEKKINDIIFEAEMGLMNTPTNSYNLVYQSSSSKAIVAENINIVEANIIDAVYIPPTVDELTDEEDIDGNLLEEDSCPSDISGTFEVHLHQNEDYPVNQEEHEQPLPK
ncbi:hypothetical protein FQA39_LY03907 [Lamprigera yunnana]|nr:hypothetical protein FQA39_LY03907 [Lamprigera yunnana]